MKVKLTGKGEVGGVSKTGAPDTRKKDTIVKPVADLLEALTRCLVGIGRVLQLTKAEAAGEVVDYEVGPLAIVDPEVTYNHFGDFY